MSTLYFPAVFMCYISLLFCSFFFLFFRSRIKKKCNRSPRPIITATHQFTISNSSYTTETRIEWKITRLSVSSMQGDSVTPISDSYRPLYAQESLLLDFSISPKFVRIILKFSVRLLC